jgi:hypothetical protein
MPQVSVTLENAFVRAEIHPLGAMLGPARFRLRPDGRSFDPLFSAPWSQDQSPEGHALPALLKHLRGEWPCVPFGSPVPRADLPLDWRHDPSWHSPTDPFFHGYGSHHEWRLSANEKECLAWIDCPPDHPIERLERGIRLREGAAALDFRLDITARRDCALPIALHPVFRLPARAAPQAELVLSAQTRVWTFPAEVEPRRSLLAPDQRGIGPDAVHSVDGIVRDLRRLPFDKPGEDLVLLTGTGGSVSLANHAEGYVVSLNWDAMALPSCLLWISGGGRLGYPWLGRVLAVGIEPCCAPFDLGPAYGDGADTPLQRAGVATSAHFRAGQRWQTRYVISISESEPGYPIAA